MPSLLTSARKTEAPSAFDAPRIGFWTLFLIIALASVLCAVAPLDRDEGAFLVIAQEVLHGRIPYRDVFDQKPPGIYYLLAGLLWLTQKFSVMSQIIVLRLCTGAINVVTGIGLLKLGTRWWRSEVGRLAALFWLSACVIQFFGANQLFTEPFAVSAVVWAAVVLSRGVSKRGALSAGVLIAVGSLFKQTAILALPTFALLIYTETASFGAARLRRAMLSFCWLLAGVVAPWLAVSTLFIVVGGGRQFIYDVALVSVFGYPPARNGLAVTEVLLGALLTVYCGPTLLLLITLVTHAKAIPMAMTRIDVKIAALALLITLRLLTVVEHPYPHYLIQLLPWLALLLAASVAWRTQERRAGRMFRPMLDHIGRYGRLTLLGLPMLIGLALALQNMRGGITALSEQIATGARIAAVTSPHTRLLIAPAEPEYYYLSGRLPVTPYVYLLPVDYATFPLASVTGDIRAQRFDVVVWAPHSMQNDAPQQFATMLQTLQQRYTTDPHSDQSVMLFRR